VDVAGSRAASAREARRALPPWAHMLTVVDHHAVAVRVASSRKIALADSKNSKTPIMEIKHSTASEWSLGMSGNQGLEIRR